MTTQFEKLNSTYNVTNSNETLTMTGQLVYSNKIDNLYLSVHKDGTYIGNISYQEFESENSMNTTVGMEYMFDAINLLQVIINDCKEL